jgi:hypothetical protein
VRALHGERRLRRGQPAAARPPSSRREAVPCGCTLTDLSARSILISKPPSVDASAGRVIEAGLRVVVGGQGPGRRGSGVRGGRGGAGSCVNPQTQRRETAGWQDLHMAQGHLRPIRCSNERRKRCPADDLFPGTPGRRGRCRGGRRGARPHPAAPRHALPHLPAPGARPQPHGVRLKAAISASLWRCHHYTLLAASPPGVD